MSSTTNLLIIVSIFCGTFCSCILIAKLVFHFKERQNEIVPQERQNEKIIKNQKIKPINIDYDYKEEIRTAKTILNY